MRHHSETIERFAEKTRADDRALGLVVTGSVARGTERADSDVDVYLIVTEEAFEAARASGTLSYIDSAVASYAGGYVDVKVVSPRWLQAAREHADEPTRASLTGAMVNWSLLPELDAQLAAIADVRDDASWQRALVTHVATYRLYGGYFLGQSEQLGDPLLRYVSATQFAMAVGRAVLAKHRVLFAGPKYLQRSLHAIEGARIVARELEAFLEQPTSERAASIMTTVEPLLAAPLTPEATLSRYVEDHELAWLWNAPLVETPS
jgi:predicted nucleotidyltransferase